MFSVVDGVEAIVCSAVAVGSANASSSTDAEFQRELQYGCSVDSSKVNSSANASFA